MPAPDRVLELVDHFHTHLPAVRARGYNEAQVRIEFINPLFEALGWDIANTRGLPLDQREVITETTVRVGRALKAPDYAFGIGGARKFFVEAKEPGVNLDQNPAPALQLRVYGWNAGLPLSILTDFEEFAVYDCRYPPDQFDLPTVARVDYLKYTDYPTRWDSLTDLFSRDAVLSGALDRYADHVKTRKGAQAVDQAFLREIERWRDLLAQDIARRNPGLTVADLNYAVQMTIDRLIFLRIAEDRGLERYGLLQDTAHGGNVYDQLALLFRQADQRYNSGLFHFAAEKGREREDSLTLDLSIGDGVLADIVKHLYYPSSPYTFDVMPVEVLGRIYEQFLGKVITLDAHHHASVEEKPEVRKAGGVYYTPAYIVDYIVAHTLGPLLADRTPADFTRPAAPASLRVLDPACGSGSFLLGAYQYLLDWYRDQYAAEPSRHKAHLRQLGPHDWRLTLAERKRILLDHIYGVDIDSQAVEVTKLSLLLKLLEGETDQSVAAQLSWVHQRALPDLAANIQCGNSLIGPDYLAGRPFDADEARRVNPFDWSVAFPAVFQGDTPGFDAVIGNPPYIPIESMSDAERRYYQDHFPELERKYDSSIAFILAGLSKLASRGRLGYISSLTWQTGENYGRLREYLFTKAGIEKLVNLPFDVFKSAYVDTGVYVLTGAPNEAYQIYRFPKKARPTALEDLQYTTVPTGMVTAPDYKIILEPVAQTILNRLIAPAFVPLGSFTKSTQGLAGNRFSPTSKPQGKEPFPFLVAGQVYRYDYQVQDVGFVDMADYAALKPFYRAEPKLLIRRVINRQDRLMCAFTNEAMVFKKDINPFVVNTDAWRPMYVLGLLNSRLMSYLYVNTSSIATKDDFRQTTLAELRRLPITVPSMDVARHDQLVALVEQMLDLHRRLAAARTPADRAVLERAIAATDKDIDRLVYALYDLTATEIALVEGATA